MSDYPMLISNKLHSFRNFSEQINIYQRTLLYRLQLAQNTVYHPINRCCTHTVTSTNSFILQMFDH